MDVGNLLEQIDIVELASQFTSLEEKNGEFWGLSPFKSEKTPSFSVRRETGTFYDFSSGLGGSHVALVQHYFKISKRDAIEWLKQYAGCDGELTTTKKLAAVEVAKKFRSRAKQTKQSKAVVLPDDYMGRYVTNLDKLAIWEQEGISFESMERFQVRYDDFSDRLVFPIRNIHGQIINVSGRTVDPKWKDKGLRKYTYFKPLGALETIYGFAENRDEILRKKEIILFEGAKSVMMADTWGIRNCGAVLTSHLSAFQMKFLAKLGVRVVFALDKEVPIREDQNITKLKRYTTVEYIWDRDNLLDEKMAPVDAGREVWERLYETRLSYR